MEQKKKDLNSQSVRDLTQSQMLLNRDASDLQQKLLAQRLYAKYSDTGHIIPNKLVGPPMPGGSSILGTHRRSMHIDETMPLSKKSASQVRLKRPDELMSPTSADNRKNSQMRAKLPKINSRKHIDISQTPLPTLPFPRVLGKDIISPFPGSQDHQALKRIIAQHQAQAQAIISESQNMTASTSQQILHSYRQGNSGMQGMGGSGLLAQSQSQLTLKTNLHHNNQNQSTLLHNQSTLSLISPADKTLAILEQLQRRGNNNRTSLTHHQSFQHLLPIDNSKMLNSTLEPLNHHNATEQTQIHNSSALILRNVPLPNYETSKQVMTFDPSKIKPKPTSDIKKLMVRQGMKPTPLEFIKLVQLDPDFQNRFCYCNRKEDYYDFEIVPFSEKNEAEYMTVSQRGVVHFIKGEANFMSIPEWEREQRIYKNIQKIPFFLKYRTWKTFSAWKTLMRRTMIFKTSDFLNRELFILDSELSKPLLDIRMKTFNIQKMSMVAMNTEKPRNMQEFFEFQDKQRKSVADSLNKIEKEIKNTLIESCDSSMRTFREENRISLNDNQEDDDNEEAEPFLVGDETHKQMPYTQEATTRTHYKKLAKYIRLTDYMIIDSKLRLIQYSIGNVLKIVLLDFSQPRKYLIGDKVQQVPLFEIIVDFTGYDLYFVPNKFDVRDAIKSAITEGVNAVCRYDLFINQPEFETYINVQEQEDHLFDEQNDLMSLAIGSDMLIRDTELISQAIDTVFDETKEFAKEYDKFVQMYNENINTTVDDFRTRDHDYMNHTINKLQSQSEEIERLDVRSSIKIVRLDGEKMKKRIRESPKQVWKMLQDFIPKFQFEKLDSLCEILKVEYEKVSVKTQNIDQFVVIMKDLNELQAKFDQLTSNFQEIEQYNILMDEHKIKLPDKNKAKFKETFGLLSKTRKQMEDGLEASEQEELKFKKQLIDTEIPKLNSQAKELVALLSDPIFSDPKTPIMDAVRKLDQIGENANQMKARGKLLNVYQKFLELDDTPFDSVNDACYDWDLKYKLWKGLDEWQYLSRDWINTKFTAIDVEDIQKQVDKYDNAARSCFSILKDNPVTTIFKEKVDVLKSTMPVVSYLRSDLQERHWQEIYVILGMELDLSADDFTLSSLIELNVKQEKDKIGEIAMKAEKEKELEATYEKVATEWRKACFETKNHKDSYYILGSTDEINTLLEESMVTLSNVLGARFVDIIREQVEVLYRKLQYIENLLNEWQTFQRTWMYLENIFNGSDIASKMGQDAKKFQQVDAQWKDIMKNFHGSPGVMRALGTYKDGQQYLDLFRNNNKILDDIQKSLEVLLEKKRTEFPRFYFLSNDELLSILAEASRDPECVQPHLRKLFENINRITFEYDEITRIISAEKEVIKIRKVKTGGNNPVEKWLLSLQENMELACKKFIKDAHQAYKEDEEFKRHAWVMEDHPAQAICVVASINWCGATENLLRDEDDVSEGLTWWYSENVKQLEELTKIVCKTDLDQRKRKAVVALITQDVHYRDIVEDLIKDEVESMHDFKWQQQLRYYYANEDITIKQVNATLRYGYEYLGAHTRLVITPLTDRCWMTITGSLHIKLGAAPAGPAGTGKTESTKDLAKGLGKYCVVFNCSDQINYKMMEQLFSGLATTGSWACLDEFNRIDIEVLSVIAQQLLTIRNAMLNESEEFDLGDRHIGKFINTMGVFITMNPGYKGRTELPDNLKVLFRPVSMMIPDYALIAEIMLFAEGFSQAKPLSRKMTKLYKLASEQLSQQAHYDFGMRAVKSVLVMAGQVKRTNPKMPEDIVLIRAMRDSNIPKFIKEDLPLFNAIVRDLFPGSNLPEAQYDMLINAIQETQSHLQLTTDQDQIEKIIQFYETMNVRFGLMIIGQTLTGKTTIIKSLKNAMNQIRKSGYTGDDYLGVESETLNPKSISMDELYGSFSHLTQEWTDGLASQLIRGFVEKQHGDMKWVIFDGPVDAIWIENMNTVLDDNMTLCLSCGERIRLRPEMRMIFEVDDLSQASPATVSRCGMVYASPSTLSWKPIVASWIRQLPSTLLNDTQKTQLQWLFDTHIDNSIELVRGKGFKEPIPTVDNNFVISMCRLMQSIFEHTIDISKYKDERNKKAIVKIFIYSLAWSFGGSIDSQHYSSFEVYLGTAFNMSDLPKTSIFDNILFQGPEMLDYNTWTQNLPKFEYSSEKSFFELVVPTKDTVRFSWLLKQSVINGNPMFFTGITGVGKSIIMNSTIAELKKHSNYEAIILSFSSQTSSKEVQNQIEDKLEKRRRTLLGGPSGRKVILFIDDVNMPAYDNYGTQMPIELLRQYVDFKGLYDREGLYWKNIQDTTLICAAAPPEGGRKVLSKRFTRHFHMICLPPTQEESLQMIFLSIIDGFFKPFKKDVQMLSKPMVDSTLMIFKKITAQLRPTPAKSHYTFNLRDISKIFQGVCMAKTQTLNRNDKMIKLWIHEASRVFHDRLVSYEDKRWFTELVIDLIKGAFRVDWTHGDLFENKPLIFGDFMKRGIPYEDRQYDEIRDITTMSTCIMDYQEEYNMDHVNKFDLVLFPECLQHISRICRILRQPRGNALLVGVGGSGKQTLTRLSAFIADCAFSTLEVKKNFNQNDFRDNLKKAMLPCGIKGERTTFLINDNQITSESFLEDVNNLLNSGEIPNLWIPEDKDQINNELRKAAAERGIYENIYNFFLQRMRDNLHIVLCLSPVGESFRMRIRMFPSLVNCCAINWINAWPEEALLSVSSRFIQKIDIIKESQLKLKIAQMCVFVHQSVEEESSIFYESLKRKVYITPKSYLDLIKSYQLFLAEKNQQLSDRRNTLFTGLSKLQETNKEVNRLSEELITLQPNLEISVLEAEQMSKKLEKDKIEANKKKMVVEEEKKIVDKQAAEVTAQYDIAMAELSSVMPILQEAEAALDTLNPNDITEIKSTKSPSKGILNTMIMTYMLMERKHDYKKVEWPMCQKMMAQGFFEKLKTFKKDDVPERVVKAMDKFQIDNPDFTPENVKNSSKACYSLCKWCLAIGNYAKVAKEIEPKKKQVEAMDIQLKKAQGELQMKENKLREEMKKVEDLERAFIEVKEKKERLENEIELCRQRLGRAEKLTSGLGSEHERWQENVQILDQRIRQLVGDVFIAAACISYYGPFTGLFRDKLVQKWVDQCLSMEIPTSDKFNMPLVMGDPMEIQNWNMNGLPSDTVSISNGIIVKYGTRKPLMIDPQQQATKWIRTMYSDENIANQKDIGQLKITRMGAKDMIKTMELCIKNGYQLLIEDMGEYTEPAFEPVLLNQTFKSVHGREQINFADSIIDYDPRFKLYMTTKMPNPHYLPEMFIRVTVINFTVTQEGLEQQLLAEIVKLENPAIEIKKLDLTKAIVNDQKRMKRIEDEILNQLVNASDNILDEEDLINFLEKSKITSAEIKVAMEENEVAQVEIEEARQKYQIVAERGSILYFVIADLAGIDPMYQYSLLYFLRLHNQIIQQSEKSEDQQERINILMREITQVVYNNICRGLFNTHKLIFSFMICTRILIQSGDITMPEWNLFLKGVMIDGNIKNIKNPEPMDVSDKTWRFILNLECTNAVFEGLPDNIVKDYRVWREWFTAKDPQNMPIPGKWDESLSRFQKLLIFKAFREDKLVFKMREFVEKELGNQFAYPLPVIMDEVFKDSDNKTPIIYVLSPGAEPTALFLRFAKKLKGDSLDAYRIISLGQGQDKFALESIEFACKNGTWVLLQNCHLYKSFMPKLEKEVLDINENAGTIHPDFRLFLTSMPCDYFPVSVLQNGIKITNEPPKGIKSNIIGSLTQLSEEKISGCKRDVEYRTLLFSVCFFHAVIQERRKFGPLGWNIRYDFNESDFETATTVMKGMLNEESESIVWKALQQVTGDIVYGGRVTDDIDRRTLMMILSTFLSEEVLTPGYKYSQSGVYTPVISTETLLEGLMKKANSLPDVDNPEIFGMNDNADIAFQLQESLSMIDIILSVQPRTSSASGAGGKGPDQIIEELATKIEAELPPLITREGANKELFHQNKDGLLPSLTTFLLQEMERFNKLIMVIGKSLDTLKKALKGEAVMGDDIDKMYKSMLNNKVPEMWAFHAYPSLKPLASWIDNLQQRVQFLQMWLLKGKLAAYWMPAFFFPQGFLTALLQNYARKYSIAIDALNFGFQFQTFYKLEDVDTHPGDGVFFYGFFMESGEINPDTLLLEDAGPGQKFSAVPMIQFRPEKDHKVNEKDFLCPLFKTTERAGTLSTTGHSTNFVIMVEVPSRKAPKHWVLRGSAMFCQLDD